MVRRLATIFGYLVLSCLVVLLTIGLVEYGRGYSYSFKDHRVVRTGIVIIQSTPGGLPVSLDGHKAKKKTTYHQSFEEGSHLFTIAKDGYHTWQKTIPVLAGEVSLVQYVLLVPNNLAPRPALTAPSVVTDSLSRDHHHLLYVTGGANPGVFTYDVGSSNGPNRIYTPVAATPPTSTAAATAGEVISSVQWSDDASHVLVGSTLNGVPTMREMASNGSGPVDLTIQYGFDFTGLQFSGANWRQLYWISPDGLRRLDLDSQTVSAVLADHVKQFSVQTDRLLYVQTTALGDSLWSLDVRNKQQELVPALPASTTYSLAYTVFRGTSDIAVVPGSTGIGTLYVNILGDNSVSQVLAHGVTAVSFSPDGHLATFSGPTTATTYDLDQSSVFGSPVSHTFTLNALTSPPVWFDNFHLLTVQNGRLVWTEFDGQNSVDMGPIQLGVAPFGSSDLKTVYGFRAQGEQTELVQLTIR